MTRCPRRISRIAIQALILVCVLAAASGCANAIQLLMNQNNANMRALNVGMTEDQVITAMGPSPDRSTPNPYRSEMYPVGSTVFKILFFYTNRQSADGIIDDDELTPVVLKDGRLDGWGWSYWQTTAARYDIRIRVRR